MATVATTPQPTPPRVGQGSRAPGAGDAAMAELQALLARIAEDMTHDAVLAPLAASVGGTAPSQHQQDSLPRFLSVATSPTTHDVTMSPASSSVLPFGSPSPFNPRAPTGGVFGGRPHEPFGHLGHRDQSHMAGEVTHMASRFSHYQAAVAPRVPTAMDRVPAGLTSIGNDEIDVFSGAPRRARTPSPEELPANNVDRDTIMATMLAGAGDDAPGHARSRQASPVPLRSKQGSPVHSAATRHPSGIDHPVTPVSPGGAAGAMLVSPRSQGKTPFSPLQVSAPGMSKMMRLIEIASTANLPGNVVESESDQATTACLTQERSGNFAGYPPSNDLDSGGSGRYGGGVTSASSVSFEHDVRMRHREATRHGHVDPDDAEEALGQLITVQPALELGPEEEFDALEYRRKALMINMTSLAEAEPPAPRPRGLSPKLLAAAAAGALLLVLLAVLLYLFAGDGAEQ
jgi:hypothetical protein